MIMRADQMLRQWEVVGRCYVVRGEKVRTFRTGDCCRLKGSEDLWRIVGMDRNRYTREVRVRLRHELVFSAKRTEPAKRLRYVAPPYRV